MVYPSFQVVFQVVCLSQLVSPCLAMSRLFVPGSIITTASWHRIPNCRKSENHYNQTNSNDGIQMIQFFGAKIGIPQSQSRRIHWKVLLISRLIQTHSDSPKFSHVFTDLTWLSKCLWHFAPQWPRCCHISRSILANPFEIAENDEWPTPTQSWPKTR